MSSDDCATDTEQCEEYTGDTRQYRHQNTTVPLTDAANATDDWEWLPLRTESELGQRTVWAVAVVILSVVMVVDRAKRVAARAAALIQK